MSKEVTKRKVRKVHKIDTQKIAQSANKQIAEANNVVDLRKIAEKLDKIRKVVGEVTGERTEINRIADPMVEAIVKAGHILREMADKGERQAGGYRRDTAIPSIKELGFTKGRASRWSLASQLPSSDRAELKTKVFASHDKLWSLAELLRAAKLWLGKKEQIESVEPSQANIVLANWKEWLPKQPDCDLLLTDPPYSTDIKDVASFASEWIPTALNKIKKTGRAYICIGAYPMELLAYLSVPVPKHLIFSQVLVWTYRNRVGPSPTHDYKLNWQAILYYRGVEAAPLNGTRAVSDYPKLNELFSVQDINLPDARRFESWHAWQKPDELCERFVRHASNPGDLVLDPFSGTGSFLLAAAKLGREARGCDMDKEMVNIAKKRGCLGA